MNRSHKQDLSSIPDTYRYRCRSILPLERSKGRSVGTRALPSRRVRGGEFDGECHCAEIFRHRAQKELADDPKARDYVKVRPIKRRGRPEELAPGTCRTRAARALNRRSLSNEQVQADGECQNPRDLSGACMARSPRAVAPCAAFLSFLFPKAVSLCSPAELSNTPDWPLRLSPVSGSRGRLDLFSHETHQIGHVSPGENRIHKRDLNHHSSRR